VKKTNIIIFIILISTVVILSVVFYFIFFNDYFTKQDSEEEIISNNEIPEPTNIHINPTKEQTTISELPKETVQEEQAKVEEIIPKNDIPLSNYSERITKKPFGIYITPSTSPVQPENFIGYHTGTDFEIFSSEINEEVNVKSICEGEIIYKDTVGGYGGVIIQSCQINNQPATVLYGHINIEASSLNIGDIIKEGTVIAPLADNYSYYSGNERKHLHLGIHKGSNLDLKGYVSNENDLSNWIDFETI
jgi:hypothetical protein